MTELTGHPVYRLLETKYDECQLDIVVLQPDGPYEGEVTHRRAVVEAFSLFNRGGGRPEKREVAERAGRRARPPARAAPAVPGQ